MKGNITLTMIKPDAFACCDQITQRIIFEGFRILSMKYTMLSEPQAEEFYAIHKGKDFYVDLIKFMTSGPILACILEKSNAVKDFRNLIGDTDPAMAQAGTIRSMYGKAISSNAIHGSDSDENAIQECSFFFPEMLDKITRIQ